MRRWRLVVLLVAVASLLVAAGALPSRVVEVRGIPKSGTTWLEMILLALLTCSEHGGSDTRPFQQVVASYSRSSNNFVVVDEHGQATNYSIDVSHKHSWLTWNRRTDLGESAPLTVAIFRDPKDTALSFSDFVRRRVETTVQQQTATLSSVLGKAGLTVAQLVAGEHESKALPGNFFVSYELARKCPAKTLWALAAFLRLPRSSRRACIDYADRSASFHEMGSLEQKRMLPGIKSLKKVNIGEICRAINTRHTVANTPLSLPPDWRDFFGVTPTGECAVLDAIRRYAQANIPADCPPLL